MHHFKDRVVLITGSSRGIGNSIASKFADAGAHIVINYRKTGGRSQAKADEMADYVRSKGGKALVIQADISQKESVKGMIKEVADEFGSLDYLILNAARAPFKPVERLLERDLQQLVETNYMGNIYCIQESVELLEKSRGSVVFISSLGSRFYNPSYPLGSMKAAMESIVRDCAESLRSRRISVNAVCGGIVRTDSFKVLRQYMEGLDKLDDGLILEPDDIADVVLFLCSPQARGINGQSIVVDKGLSNTLLRLL